MIINEHNYCLPMFQQLVSGIVGSNATFQKRNVVSAILGQPPHWPKVFQFIVTPAANPTGPWFEVAPHPNNEKVRILIDDKRSGKSQHSQNSVKMKLWHATQNPNWTCSNFIGTWLSHGTIAKKAHLMQGRNGSSEVKGRDLRKAQFLWKQHPMTKIITAKENRKDQKKYIKIQDSHILQIQQLGLKAGQ